MKNVRFKNHDWFLTLIIFALTVIGLVVLYSATFTAQTPIEGAGTVNRQLVFVILGFLIYFLVSRIDPVYYRYTPIRIALFVIIVGLLLYVWIFGDPVRETNRWIEWGFVRIQPSEYSKVILIVLNSGILAEVLKKREKEDIKWSEVKKNRRIKDKIAVFFLNFRQIYPIFYSYLLSILISVVCIVLILVEPALGNAMITALICLSLLLISFPKQKYTLGLIIVLLLSINLAGSYINFGELYERIGISLIINNFDIAVMFLSLIITLLIIYILKLKIFPVIITILCGVILVISFSYVWNNVLKEYQRTRIETFFNPEDDPQGAGWQLRQAKIAIGSGRILGKGFLQGSQSKLRYLPEAYSDFIFAALCEEFGLFGAVFLLILYVLLLLRILKAAKSAQSNYESLICFGAAIMILVHVFINTGMNMGILPITGIPLPLISYGGSSVMVTMIALGLVQAVNMHRDVIESQEVFGMESE